MVKPLIWLLALCAVTCQAQVTSRVTIDKSRIYADESILLSVIANDRLGAAALDVRPLLRNFVVGEVRYKEKSVANQLQSLWQIPLMPLHSGPQQIPSLTLAGTQTAALPLEVLSAAAPIEQRLPQLLSIHLAPPPYYAGTTLLYQVTVAQPAGVRLDSLTPPQLAEQPLEQIGADQIVTPLVAGKRQRQLVRTYRLKLTQAGTLRVTGPLLQGSYLHPESLKTDTLLQQAPEQQLTVQPLPDAAAALSSRQVSAHLTLQPHSGPYLLGTPILASLTLQAVGNSLDQLPDPTLPELSGMRVYLDGSSQQEKVLNQQLIAEKQIRYAFIPQLATTLQLTPLKIDWFNLNSRTTQVTTIAFPPLAITAAPGSGGDTPAFDAAPKRTWPWALTLVLGVLGLLLCAVFALIWYYRQNKALPLPRSVTLWLQLRQALRDNNPERSHQLLLHWGQIHFRQPEATGIEMLACYRDLQPLLDALLAACYAQPQQDWQGRPLLQALRRWRPSRAVRQHRLNPDSLI